ncbi:sulfatase family protein [Nocardioides marinquilinus]
MTRPTISRTVRSRLLVSAMVTAMVGVTACSGGGGAGGPERSPTSPEAAPRPVPSSDLNVMVFVMDDAGDVSCRDFGRSMPKSAALLRDRGRCFEGAQANAPSCAPSRAALMTGQNLHNNGVLDNQSAPNIDVTHTVQHQLEQAGWNTYGTGKFFNGIKVWDVESGKRPSGFGSSDFWSSSKPLGYKLWDEETQSPQKPERNIHATTRVGMFLRSFIKSQADSERPFYAYAAFKAPHTDNSAPTLEARLPKATKANRTREVPPFRYDPEADTRDKLPIFQQQLAKREYYARFHQARARATYDVDDEMGKAIDLLREQGELANTAIFLTSDQGYHLGENGWETKGDPYPTTLDVPLLAWLPSRFGEGKVDRSPVQLLDVAPTIYDLTGVEPDYQVDGRSMLRRQPGGATYAEVVNKKAKLSYPKEGFAPGRVPSWSALRRGPAAYIEYYDKDGARIRREFYRDPGMKRNLLWQGHRADRPSDATLARFSRDLRRARTCAGAEGSGAPNPCP